MNFKKITTGLAVAGAMLIAGNASATNWLQLQGTEAPGSGPRAYVWGFLQPTYQHDLSSGTGPEPTRIGPNLNNQTQFQLLRARVGVRGTALPLDDNVNYFVMWEMGDNAITDGGKYGSSTPNKLTDASVTLNNIPGARIRVGLFKTPGSEETFQGIPALNYINFSWADQQLVLERFPLGIASPTTTYTNAYITPAETAGWSANFGAARDSGVQVFDWFNTGNWQHSYAVMLGDGTGLNAYDQTNPTGGDHDLYLYWSSELVYSGSGAFQQGWKTYAWSDTGQRNVDFSNDGSADPVNYTRDRYGIGTRYRKGDWRVGAEYIGAKGLIFQGPEKPNFNVTNPAGTVGGTPNYNNDTAYGYYLDVGYYLHNTPWEFDGRYDVLDRDNNNSTLQATFYRTTLGVQYHVDKKTRVMLNYEIRSATAGASATAPLKVGLKQIGNRVGVQITTIF